MKKYNVKYEIRYQGQTIEGEEQGVEAYSKEEAESDTQERIMDNMYVNTIATEDGDDDDQMDKTIFLLSCVHRDKPDKMGSVAKTIQVH